MPFKIRQTNCSEDLHNCVFIFKEIINSFNEKRLVILFYKSFLSFSEEEVVDDLGLKSNAVCGIGHGISHRPRCAHATRTALALHHRHN